MTMNCLYDPEPPLCCSWPHNADRVAAGRPDAGAGACGAGSARARPETAESGAANGSATELLGDPRSTGDSRDYLVVNYPRIVLVGDSSPQIFLWTNPTYPIYNQG